MAKGDVYWSDIKQVNDHLFDVESTTTDLTYRIDVDVPHCTCQGFARTRNKSKRDGYNPPVGYCKHLTAVQEAIRAKRFSRSTTSIPNTSAPVEKGLTDKEKTSIRFRSVKARAELERDLADLRGDGA